MKSFLLSLTLFLLILGVCLTSAIFSEKSCARLKDALTALPEAPKEAGSSLSTLRALWEENRLLLSMSAHNSFVSQWEKELNRLESAVDSLDAVSYAQAKKLLFFSLEELRSAAGFFSDAFF